jgi:hypothetical protein
MLLAVHEPFRDKEEIDRKTLVEQSRERERYERWLGLGSRLFDLSQLFEDVNRLKPEAAPPPDPDDSSEPTEDDEDVDL